MEKPKRKKLNGNLEQMNSHELDEMIEAMQSKIHSLESKHFNMFPKETPAEVSQSESHDSIPSSIVVLPTASALRRRSRTRLARLQQLSDVQSRYLNHALEYDDLCQESSSPDATVCLICRQEGQGDEDWICCDGCYEWCHAACDYIKDVAPFDNDESMLYICPNCRHIRGLPHPADGGDTTAWRPKKVDTKFMIDVALSPRSQTPPRATPARRAPARRAPARRAPARRAPARRAPARRTPPKKPSESRPIVQTRSVGIQSIVPDSVTVSQTLKPTIPEEQPLFSHIGELVPPITRLHSISAAELAAELGERAAELLSQRARGQIATRMSRLGSAVLCRHAQGKKKDDRKGFLKNALFRFTEEDPSTLPISSIRFHFLDPRVREIVTSASGFSYEPEGNPMFFARQVILAPYSQLEASRFWLLRAMVPECARLVKIVADTRDITDPNESVAYPPWPRAMTLSKRRNVAGRSVAITPSTKYSMGSTLTDFLHTGNYVDWEGHRAKHRQSAASPPPNIKPRQWYDLRVRGVPAYPGMGLIRQLLLELLQRQGLGQEAQRNVLQEHEADILFHSGYRALHSRSIAACAGETPKQHTPQFQSEITSWDFYETPQSVVAALRLIYVLWLDMYRLQAPASVSMIAPHSRTRRQFSEEESEDSCQEEDESDIGEDMEERHEEGESDEQDPQVFGSSGGHLYGFARRSLRVAFSKDATDDSSEDESE